MSAEWVTALAALGTLVIVAATAIAALIQLRHMRSNNQIAALLECREAMESVEIRRAVAFIIHDLPKRLADPSEWEKLSVFPPTDPEYLAVTNVGNVLESVGTLVKHGMIEADITCDYWAWIIVTVWERCAPLTYRARKVTQSDALWENFEYLVTLAEDYKAKHPTSYPAGVRRMPEDRSLVEAVERRPSAS